MKAADGFLEVKTRGGFEGARGRYGIAVKGDSHSTVLKMANGSRKIRILGILRRTAGEEQDKQIISWQTLFFRDV